MTLSFSLSIDIMYRDRLGGCERKLEFLILVYTMSHILYVFVHL